MHRIHTVEPRGASAIAPRGRLPNVVGDFRFDDKRAARPGVGGSVGSVGTVEMIDRRK
jgi:hypothetical protein